MTSADSLRLSVLDLIPVSGDATTGDALRASRELVTLADRLGYTRYWVAEHHNMPSVASTTPSVELMYLGQDTEQIRLGSGGVMLPNHAPLAIAEQFALLSAIYGDRIDLGIGRAPGTDPVTSHAMRGHVGEGFVVDRDGKRVDPVEDFPQHVVDVMDLLGPDGVTVPLFGGEKKVLHATPRIETSPQVWLLGSSGYSAQLSAALGLPYVFAHHFAGHGTAEALKLYRDNFQPTRFGSEPRTFLSVNAVVADTAEEAQELAEPYLFTMANLRSGQPLRPVPLVGDEVRGMMTDGHRHVAENIAQKWVIGDAESAAARVRELAGMFGVDEVMIHPVAGQRPDDAPGTAPGRLRTLELLAESLTPTRS